MRLNDPFYGGTGMSFSTVTGKCVVCEGELTTLSDYGHGDYECGGRMDSIVALTSHGIVATCPRCSVPNIFKTDFLGGLYLEEYHV